VWAKSRLHLIHPLDLLMMKKPKTFWIDYWVHLDVTEVSKCRMESANTDLVALMSSHASKSYLETDFQDGDWLVLVKRVKA
jgi:tRNA (cytidine/uridine-2'-O-)-methyltransferase